MLRSDGLEDEGGELSGRDAVKRHYAAGCPIMDVVIRPAHLEDMAAVKELVSAAGLPLDGLEGAWRIWVAEDGGAVVGIGALERHDGAFLLRSVAVTPDRRGQGIGSVLVKEVLLAANGTVALLTEDADRWFMRFGFRRASRAELDPALKRSVVVHSARCESARVLIRPPA